MEELEEVSFDDETKKEAKKTREKEVKVIRKISRKKEKALSVEETQVYEEAPAEEIKEEKVPETKTDLQ